MVYGQRLSTNEIRLIESTDLSHKVVSLDVLHDLVCDGLEVANLYVTELGFLATPDIVQKSVGFRYQDITFGLKTEVADMLDEEGNLGIKFMTLSMVDLSISCDDIVMILKDGFYYIWYKASVYKVYRYNVKGIYRINRKVMLSMKGSSYVEGEISNVLRPVRCSCPRGEFMRHILFN